MESLEAELDRARDLDEGTLADAIEQIGFECTRCGKCCKGLTTPSPEGDSSAADDTSTDADDTSTDADDTSTDADGTNTDADGTNTEVGDEPRVVEEHTATVFPDEIRTLQDATGYDFRDVARPMPFGLDADGTGQTFEWALQTDACGDCTFYTEDESGTGACTVHDDRPLICETYPFSVALEGSSQPMGGVVDTVGPVRAHECDGLGRDIDRDHAESLASALKERAIRELEEAIGVRDNYEPVESAPDETVIYDSEGPKHPDGTPYRD